MDWARVLAYVTGTVDQELLARNEYLAAENRILKAAAERTAQALGRRAVHHRSCRQNRWRRYRSHTRQIADRSAV
jgi:hypothetical protein